MEAEGSRYGYKMAAKGNLVMVEMFCVLTASMSIYQLILYYSFARHYHCEKQGKDTGDFSL